MPAPLPSAGPMRVALVSHCALPSGAELGTARLARALPADIEPVFVFFESGPLATSLRDEGFEVVVVPLDPQLNATHRRTRVGASVGRGARHLPGFQRRLRSRLKDLRLDVVHSHSLKSHLLVSPVAKSLHLPLVWHFHDRIAPDYLPRAWVCLLRQAARHVPDAVVANSAATAATLPGAGAQVINPALEPRALAPADHRTAAGPVIGMLGRISDTKGQRILVSAVPEILTRFPSARVRLAGATLFGQDGYEQQLRDDIARLGLQEVVELLGHVDDPYAEMDGWTVMVHASPVPEPFGQVVTEAMARGVPVVATAGGGVSEVVRPGPDEVYGVLVPAGDGAALARAVVDVLADPVGSRERAERAYQHVARTYAIAPLAARSAQLWHQLRGAGVAAAPRLVIAHDYLTQRGGAERVVRAMCEMFPDSALQTLMYESSATFASFSEVDVRPSWLNGVGWLRRHYRAAMPILAVAASTTRIDADVALVSSSGWAHGMRVRGRKVVYCHSPARWLYKTREYLGENWWWTPKGAVLAVLRPGLRRWDRRAARTADVYVVNSAAVAATVRATYGIEPVVIHPPATLDPGGPQEAILGIQPGFMLVVCRLLPYKNVELVLRAFNERPERLLIIGSGPLRGQVEAGLPVNAALRSDVSDAQLRWAYANAAGLVAASFEDFGLTPVEAAQFGTPTVALRGGGYLDTIQEQINGVFFDHADTESLCAALDVFAAHDWNGEVVIKSAEEFTVPEFERRIRAVLGPQFVAHLPAPTATKGRTA